VWFTFFFFWYFGAWDDEMSLASELEGCLKHFQGRLKVLEWSMHHERLLG